MRGAAARVLLALVVAATAAIAGCSGGGEGSDRSHATQQSAESPRRGTAGEEEAEGDRRSVPGVSDRDRLAYYQLATVAGSVEATATPATRRRGGFTLGRDDVAKLRRARARVAGLAPRDLALRRARARLSGVLAELALVHAGERLRPRNARSAEGGAAAVVSQLGAFARQHPGIAAIAPD